MATAKKTTMVDLTDNEVMTLKQLCADNGQEDLFKKFQYRFDRKNNPILAHGRVQGYAEVLLNDVEESDRAPKMVRVEQEIGGISIHISGYGDASSVDGYGTPILLEMRCGVPHVVIWDNINDEEPSHTLSLVNAMDTVRIVDEGE